MFEETDKRNMGKIFSDSIHILFIIPYHVTHAT